MATNRRSSCDPGAFVFLTVCWETVGAIRWALFPVRSKRSSPAARDRIHRWSFALCIGYNASCTVTWQRFVSRWHRWQAISPIAIDVTVPWSVCLSLSVTFVLKRQKISIIDTISFEYDSPLSLPGRVNIWLTSVNWTPSSPDFAPKSPTRCCSLIERRRHSMANCGRMVRDSSMITMKSIGNHQRSFEWYDRWPLDLPSSKMGSQMHCARSTSRCVLPPGEYDRSYFFCLRAMSRIMRLFCLWAG